MTSVNTNSQGLTNEQTFQIMMNMEAGRARERSEAHWARANATTLEQKLEDQEDDYRTLGVENNRLKDRLALEEKKNNDIAKSYNDLLKKYNAKNEEIYQREQERFAMWETYCVFQDPHLYEDEKNYPAWETRERTKEEQEEQMIGIMGGKMN